MDIQQICRAIEATDVATWFRVEQLYAIPVVNAIHVLSFALVFGTILIVDLRLLGVASLQRPFSVVTRDYLRWTWVAFALAAVTGLSMFSANATTFCVNTPFQLKMLTIFLAGMNMAVFHFVGLQSVSRWDSDVRPPMAVRLAGALSITLWICVLVLGRWIGYTKRLDISIPGDALLGF